MATTVESLFNLPTAEQARQQYLEGMMTTPGQMNQLSLLQQVTAMGRDAGANLGFAGGRLLGGRTADEIRIQGVNEAMAEATQMGGTDADMYANLAKGLAARGLTQDAMAATEKARAARRDEQVMNLAQAQETRAQSAEGRAMSAEARAAEEARQRQLKFEQETKLWPDALKKSALDLQKTEKDLRGVMGEKTFLETALATGRNPDTNVPLTENERAMYQARLAEATLQINTSAQEYANKQAEHTLKMQVYESQIQENKAQAANANTTRGMSAFNKKATIQVSDIMGKPIAYEVGMQNGLGQVRGKDGLLYQNINEAAKAQGIGLEATPANPAANSAAPAQVPNTDQRGLWDRIMNNPQPTATPKPPVNTAPGWSDKYKQ